MIECAGYKLGDPDALETPSMLVFEDAVDHNIRTVCELAGGGQNLMLHVKSHKSAAITRKLMDAGIAGFKCATLKELEMVLAEGARHAILSYAMVQRRKVERFAQMAAAYPDTRTYAIISRREHFDLLAEIAGERREPLKVMLDLDVGMHRTGIELGQAAEALYAAVHGNQYLEAAGLHIYDGHEHHGEPVARHAAAQRHIEEARAFKVRLEAAGRPVPLMVAGSTFSFVPYARAEDMYGSPGTCTYWDCGYGGALPDMPFRWAALVLGQVVDRYLTQQTVTTDLGYKAVAGDPPVENRMRLLQSQEAQLVLQNEEHGVFHWPGELPAVGSYVLAVPGHVCPTAIRYPGSYVIDADGEVVDYYPHTARDRL